MGAMEASALGTNGLSDSGDDLGLVEGRSDPSRRLVEQFLKEIEKKEIT